jgi:acyl carrier protein
VLEDDYGIKIPDNELNHLEMDDDLIALYQKEKALKQKFGK